METPEQMQNKPIPNQMPNQKPNPLEKKTQTPTKTPIQTFSATATHTHRDYSYITKLPTFAERGKAIANRLEDIKADPRYKAMSVEKQSKVREDLYNKYVPTSYSGFHLDVPDKKTWVEGTAEDHAFGMKPDRSFKEHGILRQSYDHLAVKNHRSLNEIEMFGAKVTSKIFMAATGVSDHLTTNFGSELNHKANDWSQKQIKNFEQGRQAEIQDSTFWLETHPSNSKIVNLSGFVGEQISTLPIYEALAAPAAAVKGLTLTGKLAKSPVGAWAAKRLISGSEQFLANLVTTGGDKKEALKNAVEGELAVGIGGPVVKKIASQPMIKKWLAGVIAMGGKPFAAELIHSAHEEMEQAIEHSEKLNPSTGEALEDIKAKGELHPYAQEARAWVEKQVERSKNDPVMHKLHEAAKKSANSLAMAMHGKNLNQLSKNQRELVRQKMLELTHEAAAEAPVHLPDLLHGEIEQQVKKEAASNPNLAQFDALLAQHGIKIEDAITEDAIASTAKTTGISNKDAAVKKLNKNMSASLSAPYQNAELRGPRNRTAFEKSLGIRAKGNFGAFYEQLKDADKRGIKFESPIQRLLFLYNNKAAIPEKLADKLLYRIRQVDAYKNMSPAEIADKSSWVHSHLLDLATTGHMNPSESNMYGSTRIGDPTKGTKYQAMLMREKDIAQTKIVTMALKNQPYALKAFGSSMKALKKAHPSFDKPEDYLAYRKAVDDLCEQALKKMLNKKK